MIAVSLLTLQRPPLSHYSMPYLPVVGTGARLSTYIAIGRGFASIIRSIKTKA